MGGRGRVKAEFDIDQVEKLASRGLTEEQIAWSCGWSPPTLSAHKKARPELAEAIKKGRAKGITAVANKLFEMAMAGNVVGAIFWLKNNAGWTDKQQITGDKDNPIELRQKMDLNSALAIIREAGIDPNKL